ncbi:hypothetical protein EU527_04650 [Candidatus Thorarchaeota archaeon]|nr:MAG: hypothetical protein EU527_04650 [Candidatus Thorarchaeota archaeon]
MDFLEACLHVNGRAAVKSVKAMLPSVRTSAVWAILMHGAAWHEERSYDTSHATISVYTIHRMIETLGGHEGLVSEDPILSQTIKLPEEQKTSLQEVLVERLAYHLADADHWRPEQGPRYDIETRLDSKGNAVQIYVQSVRERVQMSALKAAAVLGAREDTTMLMRATASIAAEEPDKLGHAFIMPVSLLTELPIAEYTRPHMATLWHLTEYLVRKIPSKAAEGFSMDEKIGRFARPTNLSENANLFINAVYQYGILGHNAIFAHRISEAARRGLVNTETIMWLLKMLQRNIGPVLNPSENLAVESLIKRADGPDWTMTPTEVSLPSTSIVKEWFFREYGDIWSAMIHQKSSVFEDMILELGKNDWPSVRALQYGLSAMHGDMEAAHPYIFTQSVWNLVDNGLISEALAALQVHRLLREQLAGK